MWIIPKNLPIFRSVQAMEGLTSDLNELSDLLEQSVLWRSKPSSSKTWLRRLKKDSSTLHLFTQTLKPSLGNHSVEKWISCQEASLVNHLAPQVIEKETKTQDTSSPSLSMESNGLESLPLFSWKMSKESSVQNSKGINGQTPKTHLFCSMSLENWKGWVTKQRQGYSQRVKSVLPTNENECLYLVSEMILDKVELIISTDSLTRAWWATPRANKTGSESKEKWEIRCKKFGKKLSIPLGLQVEIEESRTLQEEEKSSTGTNLLELRWATPNTMDCLTPKSTETLMKQATGVRKGRTAPSNLREQVDPIAMEVYKQANWATPMAGTKNHMGGSIEYYIRRQNVGKQVDLNGQVMFQNWTTPIARDCYEIEMNQQIPNRKDGKSRMDTMPWQIHHQENYRGKLNPRWVEMLMGVPIGWTMPSCTNPVTIEQMSLECLEMGLCQRLQQEPSSLYGESWATPQARDWKGTQGRTNKEGKLADLPAQTEGPWSTWPMPNARDWKDTLNTVPPSINQTRGYSLGQALAEELQQQPKLWNTPRADQRGDNLSFYMRRTQDKIKKGKAKFSPTLQVQVEAEEKCVNIEKEINSMKKREDLLKAYPGAKETTLILPEIYDHCVLGIRDGLFVYSSSCIINTLYQENLEAIKNGVLELYGEHSSIEDSALDYSLEMFYHNIQGAYLKEGPYFLDEEEDNDNN